MSKGAYTGAFIEPLILYFVLFFSGSALAAPMPEAIAFSPQGELMRIFLYHIPSLSLIWYLLLRSKSPAEWGIKPPAPGDLVPLATALPGLVLIGFAISAVSPLFPGIPEGPAIETPSGAGWLVMILSCVSTGYLEESFFRFYLHRKLEDRGVPQGRIVIISVLLFSICHVYEGPWGCLNAVLAGFLLSFTFIRFRSLHGVALAHGLYNVLVYATGAL
jgi:membrane protease YdiL (CAAX protease family)